MKKPHLYSARYLLPIASPPIEDGAIVERDGRIVAVGHRHELLRAHQGAAVVDFGESVILPPLVNAHTHLELTRFPGWAKGVGEKGEPKDFVSWIQRVIRVKRAVPLDAYAPAISEGVRLCLKSGTGAVGDIVSYFPARRSHRISPLKGRLFYETLGVDPEQGRKILAAIGDLVDEGACGDLACGVSPHSPYTLSATYLESVLDFARRRRLPVSIHCAESAEETAFLDSASGAFAERLYPYVGWGDMVPPSSRRSPVAYLADRGGLAPSTLLVHGVQVTEPDVERIAASGASVVLCPRSNARLGVGLPPIDLYRHHNVPLAFGTDSLASCNSLSVWDEIAFARERFEGILSAAELLGIATRGGARALGLDGEMGALLPGYGTHFQVLTPKALPAAAQIGEFLCSSGRTADVRALYLDGRDYLRLA